MSFYLHDVTPVYEDTVHSPVERAWAVMLVHSRLRITELKCTLGLQFETLGVPGGRYCVFLASSERIGVLYGLYWPLFPLREEIRPRFFLLCLFAALKVVSVSKVLLGAFKVIERALRVI